MLGTLLGALLTQSVHAAWPPTVPSETELGVRNTTDFARSDELVRGGVPIPRSRNLGDLNSLALIDEGGNAVPASFVVLARWDAALADTAAPIQWLLVRFHASVPAQGSRTFRLRMDGSVVNPAPPLPLTLSANGGELSIDTGVARFVLGGAAERLFDRIEGPAGTLLASAASVTSSIDAEPARGFSGIRRVLVEHSDALAAVVIVEGEYAHPDVGGASIRTNLGSGLS